MALGSAVVLHLIQDVIPHYNKAVMGSPQRCSKFNAMVMLPSDELVDRNVQI